MKLMVQSYNNGGSAYNAEAEETAFRSYSIRHRFNASAEAVITLADPSGTIAQKYNVDANDVYVGPGKVTIEDPNETDIFFGRIVRAEADTQTRTVTLYCEDWLSQLDDEHITKDMREDLDGSGLRESAVEPDPDSTLYVGPAFRYEIEAAIANDGGATTDETTEAKNTTANDMTLLPAVPAVNDDYRFGFHTVVTSLILNVGTAGVGTWTIAWEYWDGDSWEALADISDGTSGFTVSGTNTISWTDPGDMAEVLIGGYTCYWVRARVSAYTAVTTQPLGTQALTAEYYMYDDDMAHDADEFNGMYIIFSDAMAGTNTWSTGPYDKTVTGGGGGTVDRDDDDPHDLWEYDGQVDVTQDDEADYTVDYDYRIMVGHNDATSFYVDDSISAAEIEIYHQCVDVDYPDSTFELQIDDKTDGFISLGYLKNDGKKYIETIKIPDDSLTKIVDSDGILTIRISVVLDGTLGGNGAATQIYYLRPFITCDTTGYSSAVSITDTEAKRYKVGTDLTAAATRIWDGTPYSIARPIYKHIDSAETPGTLITDGDAMQTLTCAGTIEHTSGISTRKYENRTRLEILQDLARQDKAEFYMALGTATLTYKSTWGANDNTITDATVNSWRMVQDWEPVFNEYDVYGMRVGDRQLYSNVTDATSIAKYLATRTKVVRESYISEYDTNIVATNRVAQDKDVQKMLSATLAGFDSTYRLGIITEVTSAYMGISAVDYIVTSWAYDSNSHESRITLHPKVSVTGLQESKSRLEQVEMGAKTATKDLYVPEPSTQ